MANGTEQQRHIHVPITHSSPGSFVVFVLQEASFRASKEINGHNHNGNGHGANGQTEAMSTTTGMQPDSTAAKRMQILGDPDVGDHLYQIARQIHGRPGTIGSFYDALGGGEQKGGREAFGQRILQTAKVDMSNKTTPDIPLPAILLGVYTRQHLDGRRVSRERLEAAWEVVSEQARDIFARIEAEKELERLKIQNVRHERR